jgi:L-amino acid N-acyltransferase YncA
MKKQRIRERRAQIVAQHQALYPVEDEIIVNPNIPKIPIYLRPAQLKDIPGITSVYNHYVLNTIIPEDQTPVSEQHMEAVLADAREQELPFIVAIRGQPPKGGRTSNAEQVLGFAHTDFYNYGHSGTHTGLSRFTGVIHLYVEPNHTRKGVGRSLMDRLLVCSSFSHASKEGYDWISPNPREATVYRHQGGAQRFHQLLIYRPVEMKDDPDHEWLKEWLHGQFYIEEVGHMRSIARSCTRGTEARFLDVLIFQFEAAIPGSFDITR